MQTFQLTLDQPLMGIRVLAAHKAPAPAPVSQNLEAAEKQAALAERQKAELVANATRAMDRCIELLEDYRDHREQLLDEMQHMTVELACTLAAKVIGERSASDETMIVNSVRAMLQRLAPAERIRLLVHPSDVHSIRDFLRAPDGADLDRKRIEISADPSLKRGDCVAESELGDLASLVEVQLMDLRHALLEGLDHAETERRSAENNDRPVRRYPDRRQTS